MPQVFISHATKDLEFARDVIKCACDTAGLFGWVSSACLCSGADWERQIRRALTDSQWFVVVMSPNAVASEWVRAETHWALENMRGYVVPVMHQNCDPASIHLRLGTLQFVDFRAENRRDDASKQLIAVMLERQERQLHGSREPRNDATFSTVLTGTGDALPLIISVESAREPPFDFRLMIRTNLTIGRGKDVDVRLNDDSVSRRHARITLMTVGGRRAVVIADLGSANGTLVNGVQIEGTVSLNEQDVIELGSTRLCIEHIGV